jgi:hypothetical protein
MHKVAEHCEAKARNRPRCLKMMMMMDEFNEKVLEFSLKDLKKCSSQEEQPYVYLCKTALANHELTIK